MIFARFPRIIRGKNMFGSKKNNNKKVLKVIIVGCGKVGSTLVEQLSRENAEITVVDTNSSKVQEITNIYDVMGVVGNGASYSVQMEAGIETSDLIIAVTGSDELNLLCCTIAKQVANCNAIARVRTPDYSKEVGYLREKLGLAMIINPEMEAAREISRIIYLPSALEVNAFAHGRAELIKFKIPEGNMLDGMAISGIRGSVSVDILVCAIERDGEVIIPSGDFVMQKGDKISFVCHSRKVKTFLDSIGIKTNPIKDTIIIGGGKAAYYLAARLLDMGIKVKIIEADRNRCDELSVLLPKAIIINGDGTDEQLLMSEGIETTGAFVPLTGIDEENVMLTLYAKKVSNAKVITKINRTNFKDVIGQLELGSVVYPRYITTEAIVAYARAMQDSLDSNIEVMYHLFDNRVEAIEFKVDKQSDVTDVPLMNLAMKKDILVSFIFRNGKLIIPSGQDCIKAGDLVMIVTTHTGFNELHDILK